MAQDFYPFVENAAVGELGLDAVRHPARIAVYDDPSCAPRVVIVEPKDVRAYLEEITLQVTQLAQGQGSTIPFMVIREIVENFIHAYFIEPTISILDGGNTIRFSDQGPGIREKERALQYGTTSATEEMRRYIRGVGSGLPYAQQYMVDKGGSLEIDDNMQGGTIVTLHARLQPKEQNTQMQAPQYPQQTGYQPQQMQQVQQQMPPMQQQGWVQQQPAGGWPQPGYAQQPYQQAPYPQGAWPQQMPPAPQAQQGWWGQQQMGVYPQQQVPYQMPQQPYQVPQQQQMPTPAQNDTPSWVSITPRGRQVLDYLANHESVGPSDLSRAYGESQPTWTRELQALEEQGIVRKEGQKRRLTAMGRTLL